MTEAVRAVFVDAGGLGLPCAAVPDGPFGDFHPPGVRVPGLALLADMADGDERPVDGGVLRRLGAARWSAVGTPGGPSGKKRVLVPGAGWATPKADAVLRFRAADEPAVVAVTLHEPDDEPLVTAALRVPAAEGWALLGSMRPGEVCEAVVGAGEAWCRVGLDSVEPAAEPWQLADPAARRGLAARLREEGGRAVAAGRLDHAARKYERALGFADDPPTQAALHLNLAAVALRRRDWRAVVARCDRVTGPGGPDRASVRARVRRARARAELGELELAREDLRGVPTDGPDAADADRVRALVARRQRAEDDALRPTCRRMLA